MLWISFVGTSPLLAGGIAEGIPVKVLEGYRRIETLSVGD